MSINRFNYKMSVKCTARTTKGLQCIRKCKSGTTLCGVHLKKPGHQSMTLSFWNQQDGFSISELESLKCHFEALGFVSELISLNTALPIYDNRRTEDASILVIRQFEVNDVYDELTTLEWEKTMVKRQKTLNRQDHFLINLTDVDVLKEIKKTFEKLVGTVNVNGQYYFNDKAGHKYQGYNGKRIHLHLNDDIRVYFQWYVNRDKIQEPIEVTIHHNDLYILSDKAAGFDCKQKNIPVIKHAVGKYGL